MTMGVSPARRLEAPARPPVILIVEDEAPVRAVLTRMLHGAGYDVRTAATLREARGLARAPDVALLLVDLRLPDGDGLELVRDHLRTDQPAPFLIVSGCLTEDSENAARGLGAAAIVPKPLDKRRVLSAVAAALSRRALPRAIAQPTETAENIDRSSNAIRWAHLVMRAAASARDLRTVQDLAREVGVSAGAFRELCRLVGVRLA